MKLTDSKEPAKLQKAQSQAKFQQIFSALKKKYTVKELAEKLGIQQTNLSSYASGAKSAGKKFLTKFYSTMSDDIQKIAGQEKAPYNAGEGNESSNVQDSLSIYGRRSVEQELISEMKSSNAFLRAEFSALNSTHKEAIAAHKSVAEACRALAESTSEAVSSHTKLAAAMLDKLIKG